MSRFSGPRGSVSRPVSADRFWAPSPLPAIQVLRYSSDSLSSTMVWLVRSTRSSRPAYPPSILVTMWRLVSRRRGLRLATHEPYPPRAVTPAASARPRALAWWRGSADERRDDEQLVARLERCRRRRLPTAIRTLTSASWAMPRSRSASPTVVAGRTRCGRAAPAGAPELTAEAVSRRVTMKSSSDIVPLACRRASACLPHNLHPGGWSANDEPTAKRFKPWGSSFALCTRQASTCAMAWHEGRWSRWSSTRSPSAGSSPQQGSQ